MKQTYLAIDYGTRRIGVAKSDPLGVIASALTTIEVRSRADAVTEVVKLLDEHQPGALIVGYPELPSGDPSDKCREIDDFINAVTRVRPVTVHRVDEQYTSQEAQAVIHAHGQRVGKDKRRVDRLAAVIILQRFLDEGGGGSGR